MAQNTLSQTLQQCFTLFSDEIDLEEGIIPRRKIVYKYITQGETTTSEIYDLCKNELNDLQEQYCDGDINGRPITNSCFLLKAMDKNIYYFHIFDNTIIEEEKYFLKENPTIKTSSEVYIFILLHSYSAVSMLMNNKKIFLILK